MDAQDLSDLIIQHANDNAGVSRIEELLNSFIEVETSETAKLIIKDLQHEIELDKRIIKELKTFILKQ